jgi:hypothetical protein
MGMSTTDDPQDPRLTRGADPEGARVPQANTYLVLSAEERAKGFVRPVRDAYEHTACRTVTTMSRDIAETYARNPGFYGATYCVNCQRHVPVAECVWLERDNTPGPVVGS